MFYVINYLWSVVTILISLEEKLIVFPKRINVGVAFVSKLTLNIYLVQFAIIRRFKNIIFPTNLFIIALAIILVAVIFYFLEKLIKRFVLFLKRSNRCWK